MGNFNQPCTGGHFFLSYGIKRFMTPAVPVTIKTDVGYFLLVCLVLSAFVFLSVNVTFAGENKNNRVSMNEIKMIMSGYAHLPEYCQIRLTERAVVNQKRQLPRQFERLRDKWLKKIGKGWYGSHHLCWAIEKYQEASSMKFNDPSRTYRLEQIISEINFVRKYIKSRGIRHYGLWPVLLKYQYQTYLMLNKPHLANKTLHELELYKKR